VLAYYESGREVGRLDNGRLAGPLEFARTTELLSRVLPSRPSRILDVGGGPGVYSQWLAERGHRVRLIDTVSLHVERARSAGVDARRGEATDLEEPDGSVDVVLLMGPLYHLFQEADRLEALRGHVGCCDREGC
jgi:2-polyprenyl-3-methyl-5-hydroxy-6-metoxy-1,4-benzoquinol methylase